MRLESVLFSDSPLLYKRMARVLELSVQENSPSTPLTMHYQDDLKDDRDIIAKGRQRRQLANYIQNARKTKHHSDLVQAARDGDTICFLDSDMLVLGDLSPLSEIAQEHDICITYHSRPTKFAFNSGLVVVRVSPATRELYQQWVETALRFMMTPNEHNKYRPRYGGINQCSLQHLISGEFSRLSIGKLETKIWNACGADHPFSIFEDRARVIHLLAALRTVIGRMPPKFHAKHPLKDIALLWHKYNKICLPLQV